MILLRLSPGDVLREDFMPIDFSNAWNTGVKIINQTISLLPNILLALLILFAFLLLGDGR